ncbi:hypothetical protein P5G62_028135 [Neobacillus sp. 179-C4.2 HS]|uniref:DUF4064 domain-containing protein n=1 Tax=Neobacillus driksii TaxID=3035913 RepID=A0ABV4Z3T2_9BACI|nr:hypothetical protein [Neobacillus sp. 179.-C4.2 HS]MDP5195273.1 hypothetical protein [Neobacillus sp. 179.-C4.2 HS]
MNLNKVIRLLAIFSIIGGFFRALMCPLALVWGMNSPQELTAGVLGTLFMGLGIFGLYFSAQKEFGKLGFTGFILYAIGNFILMGMVFTSLVFAVYDPKVLQMDMPPLPILVASPFMMVTVMLSMILLGIAVLKTKVFSTVPAILLALAPILNFIPFVTDFSVLAWGVPFMWFGVEVLKKSRGREVVENLSSENRNL